MRSARLVRAPALSPARRESVANVPGSCPAFLAHLEMQPEPGRSPVPLHGGGREIQCVRGFFNGKAAEESHLDNAALLRIELGQFVQSVIESDHVHARHLECETLIERQSKAAVAL